MKPLIAAHLACPADSITLRRDERGRPWLQCPRPDWDANWSHSGDYLLLGLTHGRRLGVDIELKRPIQQCLPLAERFFHPSEVALLQATPAAERWNLFFRLWCAKEALLKACGCGIGFGLHRLTFTLATSGLRLTACDPKLGRPWHWQIRQWTPLPGYQAAIAYTASTPQSERLPGDADIIA